MEVDKNTIETTEIKAPVAEKIDSAIVTHGHTRIDPYFWMRLTDEQKNAETLDEQTQKVLDYLNAENSYMKTKMKHTEDFQDKLYEEIVGRIKKTDESVPYFKKGYWYSFENGNLSITDKNERTSLGLKGTEYSKPKRWDRFSDDTRIGWRGPAVWWDIIDDMSDVYY